MRVVPPRSDPLERDCGPGRFCFSGRLLDSSQESHTAQVFPEKEISDGY
jgi:hypothetical protein